MKTKEVLEALNIARSCLAQHPMIPILSHFCFTGKEIVTFNGTQGLSINFASDLNCAIPGDIFYRLLSSFQTETIQIEQKEKTIEVKSGEHVSKIAILAPTEFLFKMPSLEDARFFPINEEFIQGVDKCLMSVNDNPVIKNQYGITLDNKPGNTALYSTDTIRISKYSLQTPIAKGSFKVLLPKLFSALLAVLGKAYKTGDFFIGSDFVCARFPSMMLYSKVVQDIKFLPFEENIKMYYNEKTELQPIPPELYDTLNRALIFLSNELDQFVTVKVQGKEVSIHTRCTLGVMDETVTLSKPIPGKPFTFQMDAKYMEAGALVTTEMSFVYVNDTAAFVAKEGNFCYLLNSPNI